VHRPASALLLACGFAAVAAAEPSLRERGSALVSSLREDELEEARWPFSDDEREDVHYAPIGLDGLRHGDLDPQASARVESLLAGVLSERGLRTVRDVRDLELAVREKEKSRFFSFATASFRDPGRYWLALFGEPESAEPWGFRYEGHHLSLNVTDVPGRPLSTTPLFLGAEPRVVPEGWPSAGVAVLGEEERLARALHASLPEALRARATLPYEDGRGLMLGQVRRVQELGGGRGVARGEMPAASQALLDQLVERFVGLLREDAARARRAEIDAAGRDLLGFAFCEAGDPPGAFYVRVQGPRVLIEIDNTSDGDHVHAVWHDLDGDFGSDALARHWRDQHGVSIAASRVSD
jgi:hypothetical protein